jgi:hypothetical protein
MRVIAPRTPSLDLRGQTESPEKSTFHSTQQALQASRLSGSRVIQSCVFARCAACHDHLNHANTLLPCSQHPSLHDTRAHCCLQMLRMLDFAFSFHPQSARHCCTTSSLPHALPAWEAWQACVSADAKRPDLQPCHTKSYLPRVILEYYTHKPIHLHR